MLHVKKVQSKVDFARKSRSSRVLLQHTRKRQLLWRKGYAMELSGNDRTGEARMIQRLWLIIAASTRTGLTPQDKTVDLQLEASRQL